MRNLIIGVIAAFATISVNSAIAEQTKFFRSAAEESNYRLASAVKINGACIYDEEGVNCYSRFSKDGGNYVWRFQPEWSGNGEAILGEPRRVSQSEDWFFIRHEAVIAARHLLFFALMEFPQYPCKSTAECRQ